MTDDLTNDLTVEQEAPPSEPPLEPVPPKQKRRRRRKRTKTKRTESAVSAALRVLRKEERRQERNRTDNDRSQEAESTSVGNHVSIFGSDAKIRDIRQAIRRVAATETSSLDLTFRLEHVIELLQQAVKELKEFAGIREKQVIVKRTVESRGITMFVLKYLKANPHLCFTAKELLAKAVEAGFKSGPSPKLLAKRLGMHGKRRGGVRFVTGKGWNWNEDNER